jgi:hypothetical protein
MSSWKWFLLSLFGCGIASWIPDVVIPALDRNEQGGLVTFACPALLILFYMAVLRIRKTERIGTFDRDFCDLRDVDVGPLVYYAGSMDSLRGRSRRVQPGRFWLPSHFELSALANYGIGEPRGQYLRSLDRNCSDDHLPFQIRRNPMDSSCQRLGCHQAASQGNLNELSSAKR